MTDHDDSDPLVARALREVPVPDHGAGFWDELTRRLADADADADADGATPADRRVSTAELPAITVLRPEPAVAPARRMRFLAAAAVIVVVALAAGVALRGDGDGDGGGQQAATTAAPLADAGGGPPEPVERPVAPFQLPAATPTPEDAVRTWVHALGVGDEAAAAELLGPNTLRQVEATGGDAQGLMLRMAEGYGWWAGVPDLQMAVIDVPELGAVVVLSGTDVGEGDSDPYRLQAIPAVEAAPGRWFVEPLAGPADTSETLKIVSPEERPGSSWNGEAADAVLQAASDSNVVFWFALDDEPAVRSVDGLWDPPGLMESRLHRLVVVAVGDGIFVAKAGVFTVEG